MRSGGWNARAAAGLGLALLPALLLAPGAEAAPVVTALPDTLDLGEALVGTVVRDTATVGNTGDADLVLGELTIDTLDFSVGGQSGGIPPGTVVAPGGSLPVPVSFRPTAGGTRRGTLEIPTNDPATPVATIALVGLGLTDAPTISVTPGALSAEAELGDPDPILRDLTISNSGDLPLAWVVTALPSGTAPPPGARGGELDGVRILWDRSHGQPTWIGSHGQLIDDLVAAGALVDSLMPAEGPIGPGVLAGTQILWSVDATVDWTPAERNAVRDWVQAGGAFLFTGDNASGVLRYNAILASIGASFRFNAILAAATGITLDIPGAAIGHPTCAGVDRLYVGPGARGLDNFAAPADSLVRGATGVVVAAAEGVGAGRVVVLADEMLDDGAVTQTGADNRQFGRQIVDWLVAGYWVTATPASGTVPRDSSAVVSVAIDPSAVGGGTHVLNLRVASNDPVRPAVDVPVTLTVQGVPTLVVVPTSYSFGTVPVETSVDTTLVLSNAGTEPLTIQATTTTGVVSVDFPTTVLGGGESDTVLVTFRPDALGPVSGALELISDSGGGPDPDSLSVPWGGTGGVNCALPCPTPSIRPATVDASPGYTFWLDLLLDDNPAPFQSFGLRLDFDGTILTLGDAPAGRAGPLAPGWVVQATENEPGRVTVGGYDSGGNPVPAGATGVLASVLLSVDCPGCIPGDFSDLIPSQLQDGLAGLSPCCGRVTVADCPSGDGDVNGDTALDVTDPLCALKVFTNGGAVPPDSACDAPDECEGERADADCSGTVTPADAFAIWEHVVCDLEPRPTLCLGQTPPDSACLDGGAPAARAGGPAVAWGAPTARNDGSWEVPIVLAAGAGPAIGVEIAWDETDVAWEDGQRGRATAEWPGFATGLPGPGRGRVGAYDRRGLRAGDELARIVLRPLPGATDAPAVRLAAAFGAVRSGPEEARLGAAGPLPTASGLEAIGPVPARGDVAIAWAVARPASATLVVHDVSGRRVRTLATGPVAPGRRTAVWDGRDEAGRPVAAGIYFVRLRLDDEAWTRKLVRIR